MLHRRFIALSIALGGALNSQPMRAASVQVTISNLQYFPAEIKAKSGDTVVWVNKPKPNKNRNAFSSGGGAFGDLKVPLGTAA